MKTRKHKLKAVRISICFNARDDVTYDLADDCKHKTDLFCIAVSHALKATDNDYGCSGWNKIRVEELSLKRDAVKVRGRNITLLNGK